MSDEILFPGMSRIINNVLDDSPSESRKLVNVFEGSIHVIELALHIFIGTTIRFYENRITGDDEVFRKKQNLLLKYCAIASLHQA